MTKSAMTSLSVQLPCSFENFSKRILKYKIKWMGERFAKCHCFGKSPAAKHMPEIREIKSMDLKVIIPLS